MLKNPQNICVLKITENDNKNSAVERTDTQDCTNKEAVFKNMTEITKAKTIMLKTGQADGMLDKRLNKESE